MLIKISFRSILLIWCSSYYISLCGGLRPNPKAEDKNAPPEWEPMWGKTALKSGARFILVKIDGSEIEKPEKDTLSEREGKDSPEQQSSSGNPQIPSNPEVDLAAETGCKKDTSFFDKLCSLEPSAIPGFLKSDLHHYVDTIPNDEVNMEMFRRNLREECYVDNGAWMILTPWLLGQLMDPPLSYHLFIVASILGRIAKHVQRFSMKAAVAMLIEVSIKRLAELHKDGKIRGSMIVHCSAHLIGIRDDIGQTDSATVKALVDHYSLRVQGILKGISAESLQAEKAAALEKFKASPIDKTTEMKLHDDVKHLIRDVELPEVIKTIWINMVQETIVSSGCFGAISCEDKVAK